MIINKLDTRYYNDLRDFSVVEDSAFWEKLQKSTPAMTLLKLEKLKNKVKLDANITLNYFSKKANWNCWKEDYWWKLGIHLNQHNVYVGDKIDGEVGLFLPSRYLCGRRNFEFFVNGKLLPLNKEGIPYYKTVANEVGKKKLNIECRILNPLTGELIHSNKEFSIIVMPKPENQ